MICKKINDFEKVYIDVQIGACDNALDEMKELIEILRDSEHILDSLKTKTGGDCRVFTGICYGCAGLSKSESDRSNFCRYRAPSSGRLLYNREDMN